MSHKFLVHAQEDSVGVAVEDIQAGETAEGIILEGESIVTVKARQNIPLGHKIALVPLGAGERWGWLFSRSREERRDG